ncbi:MAG: carbohydate-binding domain-containing protein [Granulosicoccus sp.]|nr:carbohydate-binding domain-containing protein [Granulosicoccus sp.]
MTLLRSLFLACLCTGLAACGGGSNSGDGGTDGSSTASDSGSTTGSTDTGTDGGSTDSGDSALNHAGTVLPSVAATPNDPFVSTVGRDRAAALANNPGVIYEVVENHGPDAGLDCKSLSAEFASCSVANIHIKDNTGSLNDGNWKLYFHSIRRILQVQSDEFSVSLVNGDLNYLEPNDSFTGFDSVKTIKLVTEFSHLVETDFMPRYWIVRDGQSAELIANTDSETDENTYAVEIIGDNRKAFNGETNPIATANNRFDKNQATSTLAAGLTDAEVQARIIPRPTSLSVGAGSLDISGGFSFADLPIPAASINALTARQQQFMSTSGSVPLVSSINGALPSDSYTLDVSTTAITLTAQSNAALFYGAQSLLGLVKPGTGSIPQVSISDSPRFDYRGMHIDVARNFHSVASMKKLIDQMAAYKMNKLHLHLTDDEGWRLEIPSIPELTSVGGKRQFQLAANGSVTEANALMPQLGSGPLSSNQGTGHYSRADFIDLLQYANARFIEVIPEIDMPAHARAAVVSMRARAQNLGSPDDINIRLDDPADTSRYLTVQHYDDGILNPCLPGTYNFVETIVSDVKAMYDSAGVNLNVWHMGGDEAKNVFKGIGFQDFNDPNQVVWKGNVDTSQYDFPWERSPACSSFIANTEGVNTVGDLTPYMIRRISEIVADAGIPSLYAYQDIYSEESASGNYTISPEDLATTRAGVGFWEVVYSGGYNSANRFSNLGFETVIAVPDYLYFDFPYEVDPKERGYYWATRFTDTQKVFAFAPENLPQNAETSVNREGDAWSATGDTDNLGFVGMQGQLWSETVRTPEQFDYMIFPRLLALAERAWHRANWERDYVAGQAYSNNSGLVDQAALAADFAEFAAAIGEKELSKLEAAGIAFRIPVPGASVQTGSLEMNVAFPGTPMQYSQDGSSWTNYSAGSPPANAQFVRATSPNGSRAGRAISVDAE